MKELTTPERWVQPLDPGKETMSKFEMPKPIPGLDESMKRFREHMDEALKEALKKMDPNKDYNFECHREGNNLVMSVIEKEGGNLPKMRVEPGRALSRIIPVEISVPAEAPFEIVAEAIEEMLRNGCHDNANLRDYNFPGTDFSQCPVIEHSATKCVFEEHVERISPLTFREYQDHTGDTAVYPNRKAMMKIGEGRPDATSFERAMIALEYVGLGLGEAGEIQNQLKKILRDDGWSLKPERIEAIKKELGDLLWYMSELTNLLGLDLGQIAQENLDKLAKRKAEGKISGDGDNR